MTGRLLAIAFSLTIVVQPIAAEAAETLCGWYINPTPGDLWLQDKKTIWTITSQGQAKGPDAVGADDKAPQMDDKEFVDSGNGHGHGCACLSVETDGKDRITRVLSGEILPLAKCKSDKSLPEPAF